MKREGKLFLLCFFWQMEMTDELIFSQRDIYVGCSIFHFSLCVGAFLVMKKTNNGRYLSQDKVQKVRTQSRRCKRRI
jgi:hypothetical protein